jgi:hypothetical protein
MQHYVPARLRHAAGAGKTFTMSGNTACYEQRGLIPRVLAALLSSLRSAPGLSSWSLSLSYLEVYNDVLYDLLDINLSPSELMLYEDAAGHLQVCRGGGGGVSLEQFRRRGGMGREVKLVLLPLLQWALGSSLLLIVVLYALYNQSYHCNPSALILCADATGQLQVCGGGLQNAGEGLGEGEGTVGAAAFFALGICCIYY